MDKINTFEFDKSISDAEQEFTKKQEIQDELLNISRRFIRSCSIGIRYIHQGDKQKAQDELKKCEQTIKELSNKQLFNMDYLLIQMYQEYSELAVLYSIIYDNAIPSNQALNIDALPYILGILDCIGELRRHILGLLMNDKYEQAKNLFDLMEYLYEALQTLKFSNSIMPTFRKKQDSARHSLEATRSELFIYFANKNKKF